MKQEKKRKQVKEHIQLEGTLGAEVLLKIAVLNTLPSINVNKLPDLSKKVITLNWSHFIIVRMTVKTDDRSLCACMTVKSFNFHVLKLQNTNVCTDGVFYKFKDERI